MVRLVSFILASFLPSSADIEEDFNLSFNSAEFSSSAQMLALEGPIHLEWGGWQISAQRSGTLESNAAIVKNGLKDYELKEEWKKLILLGKCLLSGKSETGELLEIKALAFVIDLKNRTLTPMGQISLGNEPTSTSLTVDLETGLIRTNKSTTSSTSP